MTHDDALQVLKILTDIELSLRILAKLALVCAVVGAVVILAVIVLHVFAAWLESRE